MMNEEWKTITGYENYEVSNMGNIRESESKKLIGQWYSKSNKKGCKVVKLKNGNKQKFEVHRLVAMEFVENPNNFPRVRHIDGCVTNNKASNLEWYKWHKMTHTRLYGIWVNMRNRCNLKNDASYKHYGGRGIKVCEEWQNKFEPFMEWALSHGYDDFLTIDRIDVNGNYEPSNCRWITRKEQNNNMTSNVRLTYNGVTHNLTEWSQITGIKYPTLQGRIRRGWKVEDVLFRPISHDKYRNEVSE